MTDASFTCGFSEHLRRFVEWRVAGGRWNQHASLENLVYFDRHCASVDPSAGAPTQGMVDSWCERRPTESADSCAVRTSIARQFVQWASERGLTDAVAPAPPRRTIGTYIPHHFTDAELVRFFAACDSIEPMGRRMDVAVRRITCPTLFRLLFSSGMRTYEARHLRRADVDLATGVVSVAHSKGPDQHYVAMHPSMTAIMSDYDAAAERLLPDRVYFFESFRRGRLSRRWLERNFRELWTVANGEPDGVVPYDLRHEYATRNISSWDCDPFEQQDRLLSLSKSMGHRRVSFTAGYYSVSPSMHDRLEELSGAGVDSVLPEPWGEEVS